MSKLDSNPSPVAQVEADFLVRHFNCRWLEVHGAYLNAQQKFMDTAEFAEKRGGVLCAMVALHSFAVFAYETQSWPLAEHLFLDLRDLANQVGLRYCEAIASMWLAEITIAEHGGDAREEYEEAAAVFDSIGDTNQAQACREAGSDSFWESMAQSFSELSGDADSLED